MEVMDKVALKHLLITGDTHGCVEGRLARIKDTMPDYDPSETAVIILGDVGLNYYKTKHDWKNKQRAAKFGYTLYCLRGNHEDRVNNVKGVEMRYDDFVNGYVWVEKEFPNIRYFSDEVAQYNIMGHSVLCIPGAYSVDKWYRLQMDWHWFSEEQLTTEEMAYAEKEFSGKTYDFVLSHTCPIDWEPTDLFLHNIDQTRVDKTMEVWMDKFKESFSWHHWLFGHYHQDRLERPYVEQFYEEIEDIETIIARWNKYDLTDELDWWLPRSPKFYEGT